MNDEARLYQSNYNSIIESINSLQKQITDNIESIKSAQNKMANYFFGDIGSVPTQLYEDLDAALKDLETKIYNNSVVFVEVNRKAIENYNATHGGA